MPKLHPKPKYDYSIDYRVREKHGQWGKWRGKAFGFWIGLEHVQSQIKMLVRAYPRDIEIELLREGRLLDFHGNESKENMIFEKKR